MIHCFAHERIAKSRPLSYQIKGFNYPQRRLKSPLKTIHPSHEFFVIGIAPNSARKPIFNR